MTVTCFVGAGNRIKVSWESSSAPNHAPAADSLMSNQLKPSHPVNSDNKKLDIVCTPQMPQVTEIG